MVGNTPYFTFSEEKEKVKCFKTWVEPHGLMMAEIMMAEILGSKGGGEGYPPMLYGRNTGIEGGEGYLTAPN